MPRILLLTPLLLALVASGSTAHAAAAPPPTVSIVSVKVDEGNAGLTAFKTQATLEYSSVPITVIIEAMPDTASPDDFVFAPTQLTLTPGVAQEIGGSIVGDGVFEGDETFRLVARPADGVSYVNTYFGEVVITDDDQGVAPKLNIDAVTTVAEGNDGWHPIDVRVRLAPANASPVTVDFQTTGGMAVYEASGVPIGDYRAKKGTLTFAPGETSKTISIDVLGDQQWEMDSSFSVALANAHGAVLGTDLGKVVLTNDDAATSLTIDDVEVPEGDAGTTTLLLHIKLNPVAVTESKVWLTIAGLTAKENEDFTGGGFQVLYPGSGQTELTYPLQIVGDTLPECDEVITIQYRGVYTGDDTTKTARVTILDDDGGPTGSCATSPPPTPPTPPAETTADAGTPQDPPATSDAGTSPTFDAGAAPTMTASDGGEKSSTKSVAALPDRGGCAVGGGRPSAFALLAFGVVLLIARRRRRNRRRREQGRSA